MNRVRRWAMTGAKNETFNSKKRQGPEKGPMITANTYLKIGKYIIYMKIKNISL